MGRVNEVLERWRREARPGQFATGRYDCPYFEWGGGPALIFVHGLNEKSVSFTLVMEPLVDSFRCIGYELPDGRDGADLRHYQHGDYVRDLATLVDHLGLPQAYLFGSSFGSTIVLAAMHAHPDRFPRAVVQGGFARRPLRFGERLLVRFGTVFPGRMRHLPCRAKMLRVMDAPAFAGAPQEVWDFFVANSGVTPGQAVARRALLLDRLDLRPILPAIRQPLLMIGGDRDRLVPLSCEEEVLKGAPNARRVEFTGCGHYPQYTEPDRTAEAMRAFLLGQEPS